MAVKFVKSASLIVAVPPSVTKFKLTPCIVVPVFWSIPPVPPETVKLTVGAVIFALRVRPFVAVSWLFGLGALPAVIDKIVPAPLALLILIASASWYEALPTTAKIPKLLKSLAVPPKLTLPPAFTNKSLPKSTPDWFISPKTDLTFKVPLPTFEACNLMVFASV